MSPDLALKDYLKLRDRMVQYVCRRFRRSGYSAYPTVRETATAMKVSQSLVLQMAEDSKDHGEMDIVVGVRCGSGVGEFKSRGDYQLDPMIDVVPA